MWLKSDLILGMMRLRISPKALGNCFSSLFEEGMKFCRVLGVLVVVTLIFVIYHVVHQRATLYHIRSNAPLFNDEYPVLPHFVARPRHKRDWYINECFDGHFPTDMEAVFSSALAVWSESQNLECAELYQTFTALFEVHRRYSEPMELPLPFAKRVRDWLGGDQSLVDKINKQHVIHVFHPLTSEHVVYNPLRAHRPMPVPPMDVFQWVDELSAKTGKDCDFCKYSTNTAVDEFGRQDSDVTVRMSNTFKIDAWHSMIITKSSHHAINLTLAETTGILRDATTWMQDVSKKNPHYIYPNLAWDTLPHAGASQVHPHLHAVLSPDHYYGSIEALRSASHRFLSATGENYFTAMVNVHAALGLVVEYGDAVALAMLSGKGDLEVMFLSDYPGENLYRLVHYTYLAYHDSFRQPCKSLAGAWPALGTSPDSSKGRIPAVIRLLSRGDCLSPRADFSSLEIFEVVYRPHDPWQVADAIRKAIHRYDTSARIKVL